MKMEQISFIPDMEQASAENDNAKLGRELRERAEGQYDMNAFSDAEMLSLLITNVYTGTKFNASDLAEALLDSFGSLKGVLEARPEQLQSVPGISKRISSMIGQILPFVRAWHRISAQAPGRIGNSREAESYCMSLLAGYRTERFYVIALNAQCQILGQRCISQGSLSEVSAYPRMVMETALNYNAHSVLLTHNHPGGTCAPSAEDLASTVQLQRLLNGVGILVLDHIIVAGDRTYSMIQHGDIDYRNKGR